MELMQRYRCVWRMFAKVKKEVDELNEDFENMAKKKVADREQLMVTKLKPGSQMETTTQYGISDLFLSVETMRRNLSILDQAYREQKISRNLYSFAFDILHHGMDLPEKKIQYLLEKYVYYRRFNDILDDLQKTIKDKDTIEVKRKKLIAYRASVKRRYHSNIVLYKDKLEELQREKMDLFTSIWQLFNTILMETGLVLLHPLLQEKRKMPLPPIKAKPSKIERKKLVAPFVWMCQRRSCPELPKSLDGTKMPIIGSLEFEQIPAHLPPIKPIEKLKPEYPKLIHLDVNQRRIMAQSL
ncbi:uncharacterized protein LOC135464935 isoform X2 [Liolophura sinensis]|uniref:uncharacterized protein LOC135464935 isoform X2 n=1 Tax=Liolophura sinensis TaxID=3198878 RepID=UPI0031597BA7